MTTTKPPEEKGISKKWMASLLGIMFLLVIVGVFVVQNSENVIIQFFTLKQEVSLALLILISLFIGVLLAILFSIPSYWGAMRGRSASRKRIASLEKTSEEQKKNLLAGKKEIQRLEKLLQQKRTDQAN